LKHILSKALEKFKLGNDMQKYIIHIALSISLLGCVNQIDKEASNLISVRNAHSMIYHSVDSQVYLFGGANEKEVLSDLWVLDNKVWKKVLTKNEPDPRTFSSLGYEELDSRLILFGGSKVLFGKKPANKNLLNDTWEFKNNQWKKIITSNAPSPRAEANMVYNKDSERIVLFGGYTIQGSEYIKLNDTWEFYDNNWHLVSTSGPSNRHGVSMVYDGENKSIVLFGGSTLDKQYGESKGETWAWKNEKWNKLSIVQPAGVFNASMIYDKKDKEIIRFGGWNGKSRIDETWSFIKNKWAILITNNKPSPRNHSSMVYDHKREKGILFGGHDGEYVFGDTWEYSNHNWKIISDCEPIKRVKNEH